MKKSRQEGITLIALTITIVVLAVLAGISISMITGDDGTISKTQIAREETKNQEVKQLVMAAYTKAKSMRSEQNENISEIIKSDLAETYGTENVQVTKRAGQPGYSVIVNGIENIIGDDEFDISSSAPSTLKIGSIVTYYPTGSTYLWRGEYATQMTPSSEYDLQLNSGIGGNAEINRWKVLDIDSSNNVKLIPAYLTSAKLTLHGAQGYNNAVYLLNEACKTLYTNDSLGITASNVRSIRIEDVEEAAGETATASAKGNNYPILMRYANSDNQTNGYREYCYYPTIFEQEKRSIINNGAENTTGLNLSEQTSLIQRNANSADLGRKRASTNIKVYNTDFGITLYSSSSYSSDSYNDKLKMLNMWGNNHDTYWIATRGISTNGTYCNFGIFTIQNERKFLLCFMLSYIWVK